MRLDHLAGIKRARVEMIPIIDCMFILLVFFIYSMLEMTIQRGLVVQLPGASGLKTNREEAIVITITERGDVLFDDEPVSAARLHVAVTEACQRMTTPRFVINADAGSQHRWFVRVMDELRRHDVTQVMILSHEEPAGP